MPILKNLSLLLHIIKRNAFIYFIRMWLIEFGPSFFILFHNYLRNSFGINNEAMLFLKVKDTYYWIAYDWFVISAA